MPNFKISSERVLQTAMKQFIDYGYKETTVRSIAQELHISHGSIFNFFSSKADIGLKIVSMFFRSWIETADFELEKMEDLTPLERFVFLGIVNFRFMEDNKRFGIFVRDFLVQNHSLFLDAEQNYLSDFVQQHAFHYKRSFLQEKLDVLLLDVATSHLYTLMYEDDVSLRDASIYSTRLINFLWQLGYDDESIVGAVDRFLDDMPSVDDVVNAIYMSLQLQTSGNLDVLENDM